MEIRDTKIQKKNAETKKTKGKKNEKKKTVHIGEVNQKRLILWKKVRNANVSP